MPLPETITNTGAATQIIHVTGRAFGPDQNVQTGSVTLSDKKSPQVEGYEGLQNNYGVFHFVVPPGQDRLVGSIAWPGNPSYCQLLACEVGLTARVRLILVDPLGRLAAHSEPQGPGNFGSVDVRQPTPGVWTGVIFGDVSTDGGTDGAVPWRVATERTMRSVRCRRSSSCCRLAIARQSRCTSPPRPPRATRSGRSWSSSLLGGTTSVPGHAAQHGRRRPPAGSSAACSPAATAGAPARGRSSSMSSTSPPGTQNITANVTLANDAGDQVGAYLISPDGDALGYGQNSQGIIQNLSVTAYTLDPVPGTWTLAVDFAEAVVGNEVSDAFTGNILFNDEAPARPGCQRARAPS